MSSVVDTPTTTFTHVAKLEPQDAILTVGAAILTSLLTEGMFKYTILNQISRNF